MLKNHYYSYRDALLKEEKFISKTTYFNADNGTDEYNNCKSGLRCRSGRRL